MKPKPHEISPRHVYFSRRDFIKATGLIAGSMALAACAPRSETHPPIEYKKYPLPTDAQLLTSLPDQGLVLDDKFSIYQNTPADFEANPFEIYVSPSGFKSFKNQLETQGILSGEAVRFVIHYPGDPAGSDINCGDLIAPLELARAIYEHVYQEGGFEGKDLNDPATSEKFVNGATSQVNYVAWHEGEHVKDCRENNPGDVAEKNAISFENWAAANLPPFLFLKLKPGADLNAMIKYIESFRTQNYTPINNGRAAGNFTSKGYGAI